MMADPITYLGKMILQINALKLDLALRNIPGEHIVRWFDRKKFFFILSIGRSGSMFLADLLNAAGDQRVLHEPTRLDFIAHAQAFQGLGTGDDYISEFRKRYIFSQNHTGEFSQYGEVNSLLRRHAQPISQHIPNVKIFHLVRDGRDVVRSMMARRIFTARDPFKSSLHPRKGDKYDEDWSGMDRFERLCWYWWIENKTLAGSAGDPLIFENLIRDFDYCQERLLLPLGIGISRADWMEKVNQPKNSTTQHVIPHWKEWNPDRLKTFDSICGGLMESLGYYGS